MMMDAAIAGKEFSLVRADAQRAKTLRRFRIGDTTFKTITQISAITPLWCMARCRPGALSASTF